MTMATWNEVLGIAMEDRLSDDILRTLGFKWHQFDRQPDKHWLLWLGWALPSGGVCHEDIGVEVAYWGPSDDWFCWLRADYAGRYSRLIHIRHIKKVHELALLIEGVTGQPFEPRHAFYGSLHTAERALRIMAERERADLRIMRSGHPHNSIEKDDTRGRPLPEHLEAHAKARGETI